MLAAGVCLWWLCPARGFPPGFPLMISRDVRFWLKLPLARALLGKSPSAEGGAPEDAAQLRVWGMGWLRAGAIRVDIGSAPGTVEVWDLVQCIGSWCGTTPSQGAGEAFHMAVGPSEISSSLCSIISRRMEYLRISFFTSRSSSSSSFWMKLLRTGISNLMYWATS